MKIASNILGFILIPFYLLLAMVVHILQWWEVKNR